MESEKNINEEQQQQYYKKMWPAVQETENDSHYNEWIKHIETNQSAPVPDQFFNCVRFQNTIVK